MEGLKEEEKVDDLQSWKSTLVNLTTPLPHLLGGQDDAGAGAGAGAGGDTCAGAGAGAGAPFMLSPHFYQLSSPPPSPLPSLVSFHILLTLSETRKYYSTQHTGFNPTLPPPPRPPALRI